MAAVNPVFDEEHVVEESNSENNSKNNTSESVKPATSVGDTNLLYGINDSPEWYKCVFLGIQHCLLALGGIVAVPILLSEGLCISHTADGYAGTSMLISTSFFLSGICTFLQSTFGSRLPILQGMSASFIPPTLAILYLPHNQCPEPLNSNVTNGSLLYNDTDGSIIDEAELWHRRMRQIQGAIAVASIVELVLGLSGAIGFLLRFIGPLTIGPAVALIGLDLFSVASLYASGHWGISFMTIALLVLSSYYLREIKIKYPTFNFRTRSCKISRANFFKMFPVLITLVITWLLCYILTATEVFTNDPKTAGYRARTDTKTMVLTSSPWFRVPYPGQWGVPVVTTAGVAGMIAGVLAGMVESIGDYYACARLSAAPPLPTHAVNRGISIEGICCILSGLMGTGGGTTSYSQNIGAIGITRVMQVAGIVLVVLGLFGKIGAIFVTIPDPIMGGIFCVMFGMVAAVGLSNMQYVDLNSPRNLFILGFSLFMGLTIPEWLKANRGAISTGVIELDQTLTVLLTTAIFVGGAIGLILDNTIPGTDEERGIISWRSKTQNIGSDYTVDVSKECYDLPFRTNFRYSKYIPILPEFIESKKQ